VAATLVYSIYLNLTAIPPVELEPVSVLVADFDNRTGQKLFDGLVEQALTVGIESAPHITAYQRDRAKGLAAKLRPDASALDPAIASLVAIREGINIVLAGSIENSGSGFDLKVAGIEPKEGKQLFEIRETARSNEAVLQAIGELSGGVREELGDATSDDGDSPFAETFTAASMEAARAYVDGAQLAIEGKYEAAVDEYQKAIRLDEDFGRAYASLGFSAYRVGLNDVSEQAWQKALSLMDTMTERERLRTLGVYYASVTKNYSSAIDNFASLVEKYPADAVGHNNLAVVYFYTLDFKKAREQGGKLLDIYPNSALYRSNHALYAMYASEFEEAAEDARRVIEQDDGFYKGYLPQAIAALDRGDYDTALAQYENMVKGGPRGTTLSRIGIADAEIYYGKFDNAIEFLEEALEEEDNDQSLAIMYIMIAEALLQKGENAAAVETARKALDRDKGDAVSVSAALIFLGAGEHEGAKVIADRLSGQLQPQRRAYGAMIDARLDLASGRAVQAIDKLTAAIERADLWLIRMQLGKAYLQVGYAAEALAEFEAAYSRRGEASSIFLDDVPTWRAVAELPYWTALTQLELGMAESGRAKLQQFLELRPHGGRLTADARDRLD
jgi:tetratricopeptide (TPR) repeat protein